MAVEHDTLPPRDPRKPEPPQEPNDAREPVPPELADARSTPPYERSPRRRSITVAAVAIGIVVVAVVLFFILGTTNEQTESQAPPAITAPAAPADAPAAPAASETAPAD